MVLTRRPVTLPSASNAISACVTWSRPWASVRNASERSATHFTGRPILPAAPQADPPLGKKKNLGAKAPPHVGRDPPQLVLGCEADEGGHHETRDVRVLRGVP